MEYFKIIIGVIATILTFVGFGPYLADMFKKKIMPHVFTWLVWTIACTTTGALQVIGGAGPGAWVTFSVSLMCAIIFIHSLFHGNKEIRMLDVVFFLASLAALYLWLVIDQPVWSAILIVTVDLLGFAPTVRKSWNKPYSETLFTYDLCTIRHALSILALAQINILTIIYPIAWSVANGAFAVMLRIRRKALPKASN